MNSTATILAPAPTETYGIHLLKVMAILLQVLAHSYIWSVQQGLVQIGNIGTTLNHLSYALLSSALFIPMTAGAVMRMLAKVDGDRVVDIDWRSIWGLSISLMLIESLKQALVYGSGAFFSWNVLHLIAVSIPLMLWVGSISIRLCWSVGISLMLITPLVIQVLLPLDMSIPASWLQHGVSLFGLTLLVIVSIFMLGAIRRTLKSSNFAPTHRTRFAVFLGIVWAIAAWVLLSMKPDAMELIEVSTLPQGMLIGTEGGGHIWAFFPWAGSILFAFGLFDMIIRRAADKRLLWGMVAVAAVLLVIFRDRYIYEVTSSLSATAFFSGYHFNRLPEKMVMVIALFLLAVPLFIWLARRGLETPYMVMLSRYVLWLYIYQTTVLLFVPHWVQQAFGQYIGNIGSMALSTVLSFGSAISLPWLIKRLPLNINLQMQKNA